MKALILFLSLMLSGCFLDDLVGTNGDNDKDRCWTKEELTKGDYTCPLPNPPIDQRRQ